VGSAIKENPKTENNEIKFESKRKTLFTVPSWWFPKLSDSDDDFSNISVGEWWRRWVLNSFLLINPFFYICSTCLTKWNEFRRYQNCVCSLFEGDIIIDVEEDINSDYVQAHGHFEFVLQQGDKRVCMVEAKKDDMELKICLVVK
jgi:hypothetical protein